MDPAFWSDDEAPGGGTAIVASPTAEVKIPSSVTFVGFSEPVLYSFLETDGIREFRKCQMV